MEVARTGVQIESDEEGRRIDVITADPRRVKKELRKVSKNALAEKSKTEERRLLEGGKEALARYLQYTRESLIYKSLEGGRDP